MKTTLSNSIPNISDIEKTLGDLKNLSDEGQKLLYLRELKRQYELLSQEEKEIYNQKKAQKIQALIDESNQLIGNKVLV